MENTQERTTAPLEDWEGEVKFQLDIMNSFCSLPCTCSWLSKQKTEEGTQHE